MLRNGAFGENEPIEPMSAFKWEKLYKMAEADNVSVYIKNDGYTGKEMPRHNGMPDSRKLRDITETERHSIDTSVESLELLNIIFYNTDSTISRHTSLRAIIEMGLFLRIKGDKVDYIKLEKWLKRLGISRMASLHGSILISMFNFNLDELPFMHRHYPVSQRLAVYDRRLTARYIMKYPCSTIHSWMRSIHNAITQIEE